MHTRAATAEAARSRRADPRVARDRSRNGILPPVLTVDFDPRITIIHPPRPPRGAIMRRRDGGTNRTARRRCGAAPGGRTFRLARRPRAWFAATLPGGSGTRPGGI